MNALTPAAVDGSSPPAMQRSIGEAAVTLADRRGALRLVDLRQQGSAKAMLPKVEGGVPEVVFLNTSGGLAAGDRLDFALTIEGKGRATATTQTAERAYGTEGGAPARVTVRHRVGPGGWLDWLPQETILYNGAALDRRTEIALAPDAGCVLLEMVVLGRSAMGERVTRLRFRDYRQVTRAGRPVFVDPLAFGDAALAAGGGGAGGEAAGQGTALLGGARALAALAMIAPNAEDALTSARAALSGARDAGVEAAATGFDGKLVVRMLAPDGLPLRRQVARVLAALRAQPLPRVWQM